MNNNEWITDRLPNDDDGIPGLYAVWNELGRLVHIVEIKEGEAWKPIPKCERYFKPKRCNAQWSENHKCWAINCNKGTRLERVYQWALTKKDEHREAAERIAAIYEEAMP